MVWKQIGLRFDLTCNINITLRVQLPKILSLPLRVVEFFQFLFMLSLPSPVIDLNLIVATMQRLGGRGVNKSQLTSEIDDSTMKMAFLSF